MRGAVIYSRGNPDDGTTAPRLSGRTDQTGGCRQRLTVNR